MPEDPSLMIAVAEESGMKSKSGRPCIPLPGGYAPEDGKQAGDKVQALVEFTLGEKPGEVYIDSVDGAKYAEAEQPVEETAEVVEETVEQPAPPMSFRDKAMAMNA
jgi:hypothetical protein